MSFDISEAAKTIAQSVAPRLQQDVVDHKDDVIASVSNPAFRVALRVGYGSVVELVPTATELGVHSLLTWLCQQPVAQTLDLLASHAKEMGVKTDPSVARLRFMSC